MLIGLVSFSVDENELITTFYHVLGKLNPSFHSIFFLVYSRFAN